MKIKKSKINLLDKIRWKIKYRELNSILVKDTPLMRGILKNKLIEEEYSKNKEEIANILKRIQTQIPDKMEKIEEIILQTLYKDALEEKFPNNEVDVSVANISDIIHNLNFMLNVRGLNKEGKMIYDKLNIEDCKNKYMELEILPFLGYSEKTLKKYPFDVLKKISGFISESDLERMNSLDVESIMSAIKKNVDTSAIYDFVQVCEYQNKNPLNDWNKINFLRDNMKYSKFFFEFIKKYGRFPLDEEIHELFADTRNMDVKEKMMELHGDMEYYSELRNKYFDFEITERLNNIGSYKLDYVKDFITQKYFNIKYYDIKKIVENRKEKSFSEDAQKIIMYVNKIQNINDIDVLNKINKEIEQRNIGIDIGKAFDEIYNYYAMDKLEGCFKPEEFLGERQTIKYKGKDVQILKLQGEDFRGNIHVLGGRKPGGKNLILEEERRNYAKYDNPLLFKMLEGASANLSLSTERDDAMAFFGFLKENNVILGFSNLKPGNVLGYYHGDGATSIEDVNYNKVIKNVREEINYEDKNIYDELLISRYEDTNKIRAFRKDEKRILPDYILVFKRENPSFDSRPSLNYDDLNELYTKRILEYAITYDIPIVEMDTKKYLEKYEKKYDELFQKMKNGEEKFEMKDFKALKRYRISKSFYKYNDPRITEEKIFLEIVNDLNITQENSDTIKKIIEKFDSRNRSNWEEKNIDSFLPNDVQQKTKERMKFLRKSLGIVNGKEYKKIGDDEKVL